jgi:hypothetical protein
MPPVNRNFKSNGNGRQAETAAVHPPPLLPDSLPLCEYDQINLTQSGIRYRTVIDNDLHTRNDALQFPYHDLQGNYTGFTRERLHNSRMKGKKQRYSQPKDSGLHAYFPAACRAGLRGGVSPVIITEGEKKSLAIGQLGHAAVGLGGVDCGCQRNDRGEYELIDDLKAITWTGRGVGIVFDFDPKEDTRRNVYRAARRLARCLKKAGAHVVIWVVLPASPTGGKQGADDFIVRYGGPAFRKLVVAAEPMKGLERFRNFYTKKVHTSKGDKFVSVGLAQQAICQDLQKITDNWPCRTDNLLFAPRGDQVQFLENANQLFAWIGTHLDEPIEWEDQGTDKVSRKVFDSFLRMHVREYKAVEVAPYEPRVDDYFYVHPPPTGGDGSALKRLLAFFYPASDVDRALLLAAFLTPFWGGLPGTRPAFVVEAVEGAGEGGRGVGKSAVAKMVALLAGGKISVNPNMEFPKVITRLLSPSAMAFRVALLDNVKILKFSCAELESLITDDTISGHRLYLGEGQRPNMLTWYITFNQASLSKDLAHRCVIVRLSQCPFDDSWNDRVKRFINDNRWSIIGDILAILRKEPAKLAKHSRWGEWEKGVLAHVDNPEACQAEIARRRGEVDGDQEESDLVREHFVEELRSRKHDPDTEVLFIPSKIAATICNEATEKNEAVHRASGFLATLTIPELRRARRTGVRRGFIWTGCKAGPEACKPPYRKVNAGPFEPGQRDEEYVHEEGGKA